MTSAVAFARELHCLNGAGTSLNINSQWQDNEICLFSFCYKSALQKLGRMLRPF